MKRIMRKKLIVLCVIMLFAFTVWGCSSAKLPEGLLGDWTCEDLASDGKTATDFYAMYINEDGSFSLYDTVGNPGIAGKMKLEEAQENTENNKGTVKVFCGADDFDPPSCWNLTEEDELEYEILGSGRIRFGHNGVWLSFYDENTYTIYKVRLADRSAPEYKWEMVQRGKGRVDFRIDTVPDEDAGAWQIYDFTGIEPGDLEIEMQYTNGNSIMYSVTFDLTINEDGTIRENSVDGDVDDAMTS